MHRYKTWGSGEGAAESPFVSQSLDYSFSPAAGAPILRATFSSQRPAAHGTSVCACVHSVLCLSKGCVDLHSPEPTRSTMGPV